MARLRRSVTRRGIGAGVAVGLALLVVRPAAAQSGSASPAHPEVHALTFTGIHAVSQSDLAKNLATRATGCRSILLEPFCLVSHAGLFVHKRYLDHTELARDVLRIKVYYWQHGYRATQVDTTVDRAGSGVKVAFHVTEGPPTRISSITVARPESLLSAHAISQAMAVRAGQPLNLMLLDSSRVHLRDRLWDAGYGDAQLADTVLLDAAQHSAAVRITVHPRWKTRVASVTISGNKKVSTRTIEHMITLRPRALYRRTDVLTSQRHLYESSLFRRAIILVPPTPDSLKQVRIRVQEAPMRDVRLSAGFNTIDFGQVEGRFTHFNWVGGGRRLDVRAVVGNLFAPALNGVGIFQSVTKGLPHAAAAPYLRPTLQASIGVTQPWFLDPRNTLALSIFGHRTTSPGIFVDKGYGATASFTRDIASHTQASLVYRYEITEVEAGDIYFCVNYGVCETSTIGALRARHALSPFTLDIFADHADDPLNPTRGYRARFDIEHASAFTLSDFRYNRVDLTGSRYIPVGRASVLAGRLEFGWVQALASTGAAVAQTASGTVSLLHPRVRFYAGGSQSVRGYGENQLGPRVLTVDPANLLAHGCTTTTIADGSCDPGPTPSSDFQPRPTGGTALIQGNVEYRFPLFSSFQGAVFVDAAFVGEGALRSITRGTGAITPGFGVRFLSPIGPIRVDLGIRPTLEERLNVLTQIPDSAGTTGLVALRTAKIYNPVTGSGLHRVLDRLALHLSIGQAF